MRRSASWPGRLTKPSTKSGIPDSDQSNPANKISSWLLPDQCFRRDTQPLVQLPYHYEGERALAIQNFIDTVRLANVGHQVLRHQSLLFHKIFDRFNGVRKVKREMSRLVRFDKRDKNIEAIPFR